MEIVKLIEKHHSLGLQEVMDYEKFNHISIVHHSTRMEGSTLTEVESQVLLTEGLTPKGKPLQESLMLTDHYKALQFCLQESKAERKVSKALIQEINALVVQNTARIYNTVFGTIDASTGTFRKGNVVAGASYFPNFDKVETLTENLVQGINEKMSHKLTIKEQLQLSFVAHFNLVSIHPFYDGNGRTSRLLMNYIQQYYNLPLAIVYSESKVEYIQALIDSREQENVQIFVDFMYNQYATFLETEIKKFENGISSKKGSGFNLMF